jgi:multidrug resistance efflux pump
MENDLHKLSGNRSDELEEIISSIPTWIIRYGNSIILLFVFFLLLLSFLIKYPEKVISQVTITTVDPPQRIYTQISGKIDAVFVQNNDTINVDDPIAVFENAANYSDVKYLKNIVSVLDFRRDSVFFPMDALPTLLLGEIEDSFSKFENSYIKYILLKKFKVYDIKSATTIKNAAERQRKLASLTQQYDLNSKELKLIQIDLERSDELYKKGVISKRDNEQKRIAYLRSENLSKNILLEISELKNDISLSERNLKLNTIEKISVEKNVEKELFQNLDKLKVDIRNWESKFLLKSSREGKVTFLIDLKKNDYLLEKQLVVSIVPTGNLKPIAKLKAHITNSGKIKIGQRVHIRLENYPYIEYGMLVGTISNISLVPDDDNFYFIDVALTNELITTYNKKLDFKHEMFGQAEIITKDLRLIERVLNQLKNLINN